MRLLLGSKNGITDIPAVNVLSFIDAMDKRIPKFRKMYDALSEYAHPNWSGMMLLYSKHDEKRFWTEFRRNPRDNTNVEISGLTTLMGSLGAFELVYNKVGDLVLQSLTLGSCPR